MLSLLRVTCRLGGCLVLFEFKLRLGGSYWLREVLYSGVS